MNEKKLIEKNNKLFPITKYNFKNFSKDNCVSFSGSCIQHPYDNEKFILISDPLSEHTYFYEFSKSDVISIEDLPSILSENGESIHLSRIWIKIGVVALKYEPFIVGHTSAILEKFR